MAKRKSREEKWDEIEERFKEELEKARKQALMADSFTEMEAIVGEIGQKLEQELLAAMAEQREPEGSQNCPECGAAMHRKGTRPRHMKTTKGQVRIERERWECPECGTQLFPPGPETED